MPPDNHRRRAAFLWAALPVLLSAIPVAAWAYLLAGIGGQDLAFFSWFVALCRAATPWTPAGFRTGWLLLYVLVVAATTLPTLYGAVGPNRYVKLHARAALAELLLLGPMLMSLPYAMGVVAVLPDTFSLVGADGSLVSSEAGNAARRGAAWIFAALLVAAPVVGGWRDSVERAWSGASPPSRSRGQKIYLAIAAGLGVMMVLGARLAPV